MFKVKYGFKLELQRPETMTLFGTTKVNKQNKKVENIKAFEVILVQCYLVYNQHQQNSKVLYTFIPNKSYAYLLNIEPSNLMFLKNYNT